MTPEFSRTLLAAQIGANEISRSIEASAEECAAIAARLGLPALHSFAATFRLTRQRGDAFLAEGRIRAVAVRSCVVSLEEFDEPTDLPFTIRFVPQAEGEADMLDAPIDYDEGPDTVEYAQGALDLGEAAVEEYALSLAPYPRKPGVEFNDSVEDAGNPFAALQARRQAR
ncbi:YceD family protein [Acidisoma sp. C75]